MKVPLALHLALCAAAPFCGSALAQAPNLTALLRAEPGTTVKGVQCLWLGRDPTRAWAPGPQRATVSDDKGRARWTSTTAATLLVRNADATALVELWPGAPTTVKLTRSGYLRLPEDSAETDAPPRWILHSRGLPLPVLTGPEQALPPGSYVGLVVHGASCWPVRADVLALEHTTAERPPLREWLTPNGWTPSPLGRADAPLPSTLALPENGALYLQLVASPSPGLELCTPASTPVAMPSTHRDIHLIGAPREIGAGVLAGQIRGLAFRVAFDAEQAGQVHVPISATSPADLSIWTATLGGHPVTIPAGPSPCEVELPAGVALTVTVSTPDGLPAAGATATWSPGETPRDSTVTERTGLRGEATFKGIGALPGRLRIDHPQGSPKLINLTPAPPLERLSIQLERGASIGGTLLDEAGAPRAGVRVWARSTRGPTLERWSDTDKNGAFTIWGLSEKESYVVRAVVADGTQTESARVVRVRGGTEQLTLTLASEDPRPPGQRPRNRGK